MLKNTEWQVRSPFLDDLWGVPAAACVSEGIGQVRSEGAPGKAHGDPCDLLLPSPDTGLLSLPPRDNRLNRLALGPNHRPFRVTFLPRLSGDSLRTVAHYAPAPLLPGAFLPTLHATWFMLPHHPFDGYEAPGGRSSKLLRYIPTAKEKGQVQVRRRMND